MNARIMLAEDDQAIAGPLAWALHREGYEVDSVQLGEEALARHRCGGIDLIVLDLGLPDLDGLEVCRRIRATDLDVIIIILTGRGDELDRVTGLDVGADDYVAKPFALAELLARVRAGLRRAGPPGSSRPATHVVTDTEPPASLRIDPAAHRVYAGHQELHLTPKEFDLLAALDAVRGQVVTRERLMDQVWDVNWFGSTKTLDVTIRRLRRKLLAGDVPAEIVTVRGVGFRLEVEPDRTAEAPPPHEDR